MRVQFDEDESLATLDTPDHVAMFMPADFELIEGFRVIARSSFNHNR